MYNHKVISSIVFLCAKQTTERRASVFFFVFRHHLKFATKDCKSVCYDKFHFIFVQKEYTSVNKYPVL